MNRQIAGLAGTGQRIVSPRRPPCRTAWLASWLGAACLAVAGLGGQLRERYIPKRAVEAEVSR